MPGLDNLRGLTDTELIEKHDRLLVRTAEAGVPTLDRQYLTDVARVYADELTRREYVRQGEKMEALTRSMNRLTWVGIGLTFVGVILAALTYFYG